MTRKYFMKEYKNLKICRYIMFQIKECYDERIMIVFCFLKISLHSQFLVLIQKTTFPF